jgi:hypothetical protein
LLLSIVVKERKIPSRSDRLARKILAVDLLEFFKTLLSASRMEQCLAGKVEGNSIVEWFGSIMLRLNRSAVSWRVQRLCAEVLCGCFAKIPYAAGTFLFETEV